MVSLDLERSLWDEGVRILVGIDEVGRGALAGPVSVGVVAVSRCDVWPDGLADSKELTAIAREALLPALQAFGIARAVGHASATEIDSVGIVAALRLAACRALDAIEAMGVTPDAALLDGSHDWLTAPAPDLLSAADAPVRPTPRVTTIVKGDGRCASIAAASVLAKVERDALMRAAHEQHPAYGWSSNKGYGAKAHLAALKECGPSPLHRVSWRLPGLDASLVTEG